MRTPVTIFQVSISGDVQSSTPVMTNVIVPHLDASPGNEGSLTLVRLLQV